jgi:hypothetical protein
MKLSVGPLPTSSTQKPASSAAPAATAGHGIGRRFAISWAEGTATATTAAIAIAERDDSGQLKLSFVEIDDGGEIWEYAVLVTSLDSEILSIGQVRPAWLVCRLGSMFSPLHRHRVRAVINRIRSIT